MWTRTTLRIVPSLKRLIFIIPTYPIVTQPQTCIKWLDNARGIDQWIKWRANYIILSF